MDHDEVKSIVQEAVKETLMRLGITEDNEFLETKLDLAHLRAWRKANEKVKDYTLKAAITIVVSGFVAWFIWAVTGFKIS